MGKSALVSGPTLVSLGMRSLTDLCDLSVLAALGLKPEQRNCGWQQHLPALPLTSHLTFRTWVVLGPQVRPCDSHLHRSLICQRQVSKQCCSQGFTVALPRWEQSVISWVGSSRTCLF